MQAHAILTAIGDLSLDCCWGSKLGSVATISSPHGFQCQIQIWALFLQSFLALTILEAEWKQEWRPVSCAKVSTAGHRIYSGIHRICASPHLHQQFSFTTSSPVQARHTAKVGLQYPPVGTSRRFIDTLHLIDERNVSVHTLSLLSQRWKTSQDTPKPLGVGKANSTTQ